MAQESQAAPRYLSGDKPALREFLDKFDVHTKYLGFHLITIANRVVYRYSYLTAMVGYLYFPDPRIPPAIHASNRRIATTAETVIV